MGRLIEIRSYTLKPGTGPAFHRLMVDQVLPMLRRWQVDVVGCGPSLHDDESYCLIRAYADLGERQQSQDAFYGSAEWREGPREPLLALVEHHASVVVEIDDGALRGLRRGH